MNHTIVELIEKHLLPTRVDGVLGIGVFFGLEQRCKGGKVLDVSHQSLRVPVALLDGAVTGVRASVELLPARLSVLCRRPSFEPQTSRYSSPLQTGKVFPSSVCL